MSSIRVERLSFGYSDAVVVLRDVTLHVTRGVTGVVGANGAGKSTLVRLVAGLLAPTAGHVVVEPRDAVIAVCPQEVLAPSVGEVAGRLRGMLALDDAQLERWDTLSPGERRRWQLGAALSAEPDVLLLDEPTNHVDAEGRALLARALRRFDGIALVISHDRGLLDELATATIRVIGGTARLYAGGYSAAREQWRAEEQRSRDLRADAQRVAKAAARRLADVRREREAADAQRSGARRKRGVHDHDATGMMATTLVGWAEARLGRQVEVARRAADRAAAAVPDAPVVEELGRSVFVGYERCPRRWLFELATPSLAAGEGEAGDVRAQGAGGGVGVAGDVPLLRDVRVAVGSSDRIRIAGANGAGKTSLLRALLASSTLPAERVLYLPQELAPDAGPAFLAEVRALRADVRGRVLSLVAALGVDPDRLLASPSPSPGETRKLALALGLGRHVWCAVLDEPTNHLDLPSIERLESALAAFPGAVVLVTHDDALAAGVTTATWQVADGHVWQT